MICFHLPKQFLNNQYDDTKQLVTLFYGLHMVGLRRDLIMVSFETLAFGGIMKVPTSREDAGGGTKEVIVGGREAIEGGCDVAVHIIEAAIDDFV
ncbi:hypothetical protein V6N13_018909 [Hibiscus sabdariffa]